MQTNPFRRAHAMMSIISSIMASLSGSAMNAALADIGTYTSRGHGRQKHSGRKVRSAPSGKYTGITNGQREVARRVHQMHTGVLNIENLGTVKVAA